MRGVRALLFPTVDFLIFFLGVFYLSWALNDRLTLRKLFLLVVSYVFYAFWDLRFVGLLAGTSLANYYVARAIAQAAEQQSQRRLFLVAGVVANLAILGFFKYWGFFVSSFTDLLTVAGLSREIPVWDVVLPMGISFFVFQGISYIVDVYRQVIPARQSPWDVLLYISFFPQLVAGPIVRAKDFLPQLDRTADAGAIPATYAFVLIAVGICKKVIIAHYLGVLVVDGTFANPEAYHGLDLLLGMYAYALQIYCDFSAYSDMAIGIAALLGFHFDKNFNQPYRALSITDFWRRWHISLSSWLRDYLYIPLGGNRRGRWLTYRNLLITMLLGGLWHGAAWHFVTWGALHGGALATERFLRQRAFWQRWLAPLAQRMPLLPLLLTFHFVCMTWVFFRSPSFAEALLYLANLGNTTAAITYATPFVGLLLFCGFLGHLLPEDGLEVIADKASGSSLILQGAAVGFAIVVIAAMGPGAMAPFIYFQF